MTFTFEYFGSLITAESLGTDWMPPIEEVISAHPMPITQDGKIVTVHVINRGYDIPGGHVDPGEDAITAMEREAWEEATIRISHPVLLDVLHVSSENEALGLKEKPYMLLYATKVASLDPFVPNSEVDERLQLAPKEFVDVYFADKSYSEVIVEKALSLITQ